LKPGDAVPESENYIILDKEYKLVIQNFKTSKTYKKIEHVLPEQLKELLKESLRLEPRPFLFIKRRMSNKDPISPMSPSEYSSWANRILTRIFNKPTNLTALRHSYVHTIDYNKPLSELKKITDAMGHSVSMSMGYKLNKEKK
jgi:integrase